MEIRFSMTPRLIGLTLGFSLLLLVLVFTLGFLFGQRLKPGLQEEAARLGSPPHALPRAVGIAPEGALPQASPNAAPPAPAAPVVPAGR
jgi:hypothetical protein